MTNVTEKLTGKPEPTAHLRFVPRYVPVPGSWSGVKQIRVLQQLHIHPDKGETWLDVPFFNEPDESKQR